MAARLNAPVQRPVDPLLRSLIVGAPGFEPGTSATRTQRSTGLSHAPNFSAPVLIRAHPPWMGSLCSNRVVAFAPRLEPTLNLCGPERMRLYRTEPRARIFLLLFVIAELTRLGWARFARRVVAFAPRLELGNLCDPNAALYRTEPRPEFFCSCSHPGSPARMGSVFARRVVAFAPRLEIRGPLLRPETQRSTGLSHAPNFSVIRNGWGGIELRSR